MVTRIRSHALPVAPRGVSGRDLVSVLFLLDFSRQISFTIGQEATANTRDYSYHS